MPRIFAKRIMVYMLGFCFLGGGLTSVSHAGMIGTQTLIEQRSADQSGDIVKQFMHQETVRGQMLAMGVNPAAVDERLAALTDAELIQLEQSIEEMPAGGILGVIGLVFVILMILEFTGVIDIFKKA